MWDKLDKLEFVVYQQQNVIAQLLAALIKDDGRNVAHGVPIIADGEVQLNVPISTEVEVSEPDNVTEQSVEEEEVIEEIGEANDNNFFYEDVNEVSLAFNENSNATKVDSEHEERIESTLCDHTEEGEDEEEALDELEDENEAEQGSITPVAEHLAKIEDQLMQLEEKKAKPSVIPTLQVFTAKDYVDYHDEKDSVVSENDIENLNEIDKFFNHHKNDTLDTDELETNKEDAEAILESHQEIANLLQQCEAMSKSIHLDVSLDTIEEITEDSTNNETSIVPGDIDDGQDMNYEEPDDDVEEDRITIAESFTQEVDEDEKEVSKMRSLPQIPTIEMITQLPPQPPATPRPNEPSGVASMPVSPLMKSKQHEPGFQHRRVSSVEENNMFSSITNSVRLSYQNVFSRSIFGSSRREENTIPQPLPSTNIKNSIKNIFIGFKPQQEQQQQPSPLPSTKNKEVMNQHQLSLPELGDQQHSFDPMSQGMQPAEHQQRAQHIIREIYPEPSIEQKTQYSTASSSQKKNSFSRIQSMQEANTMMDTLKVSTAQPRDDSNRNKLEKSFSDESAIFSFTSRQSSLMQSEQECEPISTDSNSGEDRSNLLKGARNQLPIIPDAELDGQQPESINSSEPSVLTSSTTTTVVAPTNLTTNNFATIMKQKSADVVGTRKEVKMQIPMQTSTSIDSADEASDIVNDLNHGKVTRPKRSRTKWVAAASGARQGSIDSVKNIWDKDG